ncbi:hypothetical protein PUV47_15965, partial [Pseudovibrio exalbescens]|nr:hypothetical protein [Pseudovibrio exalbescens]
LIGGAGSDTLYGGDGEDVFVFAALDGGMDTVKDFDVSTSEFDLDGDTMDVSGLLDAIYGDATAKTADMVRAIEDGSGTGTNFQVDTNGSGNWQTIAYLDGVHDTDVINVVLDDTHQSDTAVMVG